MRSIVARGENFGMVVAYMILAEQRTIETVDSVEVPHSNVCLSTPFFYVLQHHVSGAVGCTTW